MFSKEKQVTLEWIETSNDKSVAMSNPINIKISDTNNMTSMVSTILDAELPMLKNNSMMHNLILYSVIEKLKTVQTVENVLSYIKKNNGKKVHEISFKNGEVRIKCST